MAAMCGPTSAIGLSDEERRDWPWLRERLRVPGQCMGLMRGVLAADVEVAAVIATDPRGISRALALLVAPVMLAELRLPPPGGGDLVVGHIGDDPIQVLLAPGDRPVAVLVNDWLRQHLYLYARQLWWPRYRQS